MIHQHIYASPKPGMSEKDFQNYWLETHAVRYAAKIPQIKKYKVDTRIDWKGESQSPRWSGIAEIWLRNEKEQLESLQTEEFLQGARLDEPKWAAFWNTLVLDTDTHVVTSHDMEHHTAMGVKLLVLTKRKAGTSVESYRGHMKEVLHSVAHTIPGLVQCWQCFTRDGWYEGGETRFDGVTHLWFEELKALDAILSIPQCKDVYVPGVSSLVEAKYAFPMAVKEHWVIGPDERA